MCFGKNTLKSSIHSAAVPNQNQETTIRMHINRLSSLTMVLRICELYASCFLQLAEWEFSLKKSKSRSKIIIISSFSFTSL